MSALTRLLKRALERRGYEVRRPGARRGYTAEHLRRLCQPATVIDVGVGYGTQPLYDAFPKARFVLVEPLEEFAPALAAIAQRLDCVVVRKAVGGAERTVLLHVEPGNLQRSSVQERSALTRGAGGTQARAVPATTLDRILAEHGPFAPPLLLKVDTEGHELEVLQGAAELLRRTDTVIAEVSIAPRFEGGYGFEELVAFLRERGFRVRDILNVSYSGEEAVPRFADVVFVRDASSS